MLKRLPLAFFLIGLTIKAGLLVVWKSFHSPAIGKALSTGDPLAFAAAEGLTTLLFNQRRIVPTTEESVAFEVFLVLVFGLECLFLGFVIQALVKWSRGGPNRGDDKLNASA